GGPEARMGALSEKVLNLPALPGVYLFKDARGQVLYVGKAKSLLHRVRSYLGGENAHPRLAELMAAAVDLDTILTQTEAEALLLESTLIRQHRPGFNTLLKDDKSFPYVRVSVQEPWPRVSVTRHLRPDGARYLGPFTDVKRLRRSLREIRRVFPVRTCRNFEDYRRADRPCLYYHIKRCAGPCYSRARVDPAAYRSLVDGLLLFLTGKNRDLLERLRVEMSEAAAERRYETAARARDQIRLLERARVPQQVVRRGGRDADVVGLARHGRRAAVAALLLRGGRVVGKESRILERAEGLDEGTLLQSFMTQHYLARQDVPRVIASAHEPADAGATAEALAVHAGHPVELRVPRRGRSLRLLAAAERNAALALEDLEARAAGRRARFSPLVADLQQALGLPSPPHRVACFDISNLGPEGAVAAVVASEDGRPRKGLYRRMRIHRPGPDDVAMIAEAVERYWARVESGELPRPDLVMVDGGVGQVAAARAVLDRVSTRAVPLIGLAKREETVVRERGGPLTLPRRSAALQSLQRLRDEAHRFGITYHRLLRGRARIASDLDRVAGIGPARRAAILHAFGSVAALRGVAPEEIARRAGVPAGLARRVAERIAQGGAGAAPAEPATPDAAGPEPIPPPRPRSTP
ncbi:MAG TPA: excinuclease ABC subunit UvrC, partial [Candidatus Eisenbacteria bacterium]